MRHLCLTLILAAHALEGISCPPTRTHAPTHPRTLEPAMEHRSLFLTTLDSWMPNPALRFDAYATSYGQLRAYIDKRHEHEAYVMQEGNGLRNTGIQASSYRRLTSSSKHDQKADNAQLQSSPLGGDRGGSHTVVWGEASYQSGQRSNVEWNASSDWATVYPYVLADSLGGDRKTERYTFQGGCATRLRQWTLGGDVTFRAEHEWSTSDPRMRGVVTDLKARLGASRRISNYQLAAGGKLKLYKQTNSVEFYRVEGVVPEYQMSGLGNWYERFSGTNNSAYYKATGWGADISLTPTRKTGGLFVVAEYAYTPYRRILSSLNAMPIQKLYTTEWSAKMGWQGHTGPLATLLWVGNGGTHRRGDEIIGGQSTASEYVERGNLTMYRNRLTDTHAGLMVSLDMKRQSALHLLLQAGRQRYGSSYAYPHSSFDFRKNYISSRLAYQKAGRRYYLDADVACDLYHNLGEPHGMQGHLAGQEPTHPRALAPSYPRAVAPSNPLSPDVAAVRDRMIVRCVAQSAASYTRLSAGAHMQWRPAFMGSIGLFAELRAAYLSNDAGEGNKGYSLHTAVGVTF